MTTQRASPARGERLELGTRPGIIVVDLSLGFTDPSSPLACDVRSVVPATARLLADARAAGLPIAFTAIAFQVDLSDGGAWLRKFPAMNVLVDGSRLVQVDPELGMRPGDKLIVKRGASGFHGTDLAEWLHHQGVDCVVVVGASTSGCVRATSVDAVQGGWPTFVVSDCVGDRDAAAHHASLHDLDLKYADVLPLPEVLAHIARMNEGTR